MSQHVLQKKFLTKYLFAINMSFLFIVCFVFTISSALTISIDKNALRISEGQAAAAGQFPFAAVIDIDKTIGIYVCGGSLIATQWVLTAGQCVYEARSLTISLGSNLRTLADNNRQKFTTAQYYVPTNFEWELLRNDVGLIRLRLPLQYNEFIQPIRLPDHDFPETVSGTAVGWGWTDESGQYSELLNYVLLAVISNQQCRDIYGDAITTNTLCTAGNSDEGICTGDSGSPFLLQLNGQNQLWQIGIASFLSREGCETEYPSGFTRTYPYIDWMRSVTGLSLT